MRSSAVDGGKHCGVIRPVLMAMFRNIFVVLVRCIAFQVFWRQRCWGGADVAGTCADNRGADVLEGGAHPACTGAPPTPALDIERTFVDADIARAGGSFLRAVTRWIVDFI